MNESPKDTRLSAEDVQKIIDEGFNNRERWSEVPENIKKQVIKAIPPHIFEKTTTYDDKLMYYFILGFLHGN